MPALSSAAAVFSWSKMLLADLSTVLGLPAGIAPDSVDRRAGVDSPSENSEFSCFSVSFKSLFRWQQCVVDGRRSPWF